MLYTALFDKVLIKPDTDKEGIVFIGDQGEPIGGEVVCSGDGGEHEMLLEKGDLVLFDPNMAKKIKLEDKDYYIIDQHNILLVVDK